jgi:hypothetical protein
MSMAPIIAAIFVAETTAAGTGRAGCFAVAR